MPTTNPKTILITGCSVAGIGSALGITLAKHNPNNHVFATLRNPAKASPSFSTLPNVTILPLDVTSPASISAAADAVAAFLADKAAAGAKGDAGEKGLAGLDVLVNNAGAGYTAPLLDVDLTRAKRLYDVNLWGGLACVQGFAELLIKARGRVVNVGSVGGELRTPWIGIYASSKSALATLSETLRLELRPFGVTVQTVLVGRIATSFHVNEPAVVLPPGSRYAAIRDTISDWATGQAGPRPMPLQRFVKDLARTVEGNGVGVVWTGHMSFRVWFCSRFLPALVLDWLLEWGQGLRALRGSLKGKKVEGK